MPFLRPSVPDAQQLAGIRALIARIAAEDGREPLSDQALTHLSSASVEHLLTTRDGEVIGYAQLDGDSLEIAAEPAAAGALLDRFRGRHVLVWSHGASSQLATVLRERDFTTMRELHQLRRSLSDPIDPPQIPDGVDIRQFVRDRDEDAWVAVNAAAFAHHPEQGGWTRADLQSRENEGWFDPSGFLMAWRGAELIGFHWTKVHPDGAGEVYVIGVAPAAQGIGLGAVLLQHGLAYLRGRGCPEVLLYVDGDNTGAMGLYERYGFRPHDLDVQWAPPDDS
jgi:mycothiol synthase